MVRQPETAPISADQLIAEAGGIYAGLILVEGKCCEVDARQLQVALESDSHTTHLSDAQWYGTVVLARPFLYFQSFF